jgi:hypothetical protein
LKESGGGTVTQGRTEKETAVIRNLIDQRLKTRTPAGSPPGTAGPHLDEDVICAFVESRLEEPESLPIISHLVACASCRQTTAQLIRFESQFDSEPDVTTPEESPGRVQLLLERLASGLIPSFSEDAVFAYQSPADESEQEATEQIEPVKSAAIESNTGSKNPTKADLD